jgi:hypothetical protein
VRAIRVGCSRCDRPLLKPVAPFPQALPPSKPPSGGSFMRALGSRSAYAFWWKRRGLRAHHPGTPLYMRGLTVACSATDQTTDISAPVAQRCWGFLFWRPCVASAPADLRNRGTALRQPPSRAPVRQSAPALCISLDPPPAKLASVSFGSPTCRPVLRPTAARLALQHSVRNFLRFQCLLQLQFLVDQFAFYFQKVNLS